MTQEVIQTIAATIHGRYVVHIPKGTGPFPLLLSFHGYGENAAIHLEQLERIPGNHQWIVASVQALHPFYNIKSGQVVASWMTKQDRELAIQDNIQYVYNVTTEIKQACNVGNCLVYAGFSQGVAMAYRAAAYAQHACHGCLLLGGDLPPEVGTDPSVTLPPVLLGRGRKDEWYTQDKMETDLTLLLSKANSVRTLVFQGGHEWTKEFLEAAGTFLQEVRSTTQTP